MNTLSKDEIKQAVRESYARIAAGADRDCGCSSACCAESQTADATSKAVGYTQREIEAAPEGANLGLGCGNPTAIATLKPGQTALDLGSGAGFDAFLASAEVGDSGKVIGVDMTPEMISRARANVLKGNYSNVEFRLGEIENLPVADSSVDVIISNCVINLSPDKPRVFAEAYRVLKPGGRLAISDILAVAPMPEEIRSDLAHYTGCIAGASPISEIEVMLSEAGFREVRVSPKRESGLFIRNWSPEPSISDYVLSAVIEAVKPSA